MPWKDRNQEPTTTNGSGAQGDGSIVHFAGWKILRNLSGKDFAGGCSFQLLSVSNQLRQFLPIQSHWRIWIRQPVHLFCSKIAVSVTLVSSNDTEKETVINNIYANIDNLNNEDLYSYLETIKTPLIVSLGHMILIASFPSFSW